MKSRPYATSLLQSVIFVRTVEKGVVVNVVKEGKGKRSKEGE